MGKVALREYLTDEYNISNSDIRYVGGRVTLSGVPLDFTTGYIGADGNFYADLSEIDSIMEQTGHASAKQTAALTAQKTDEIYGILKQALEDLNKPYDINTDPAYQNALAEATRQLREQYSKKGIIMSADMENRMIQQAMKLAPTYEQLNLQKKSELLNGTLRIVESMGALDDRALNFAQFELTRQKFLADEEMNQRTMQMEEEKAELTDAWYRTQQLGYVDNAASTILGVPVGTPSLEARQRAEQLIDYQTQQDILFEDMKRQYELKYQYDVKWMEYQMGRGLVGGTGGGGGSYSSGGGTTGGTTSMTSAQTSTVGYNSLKTSLKAQLDSKGITAVQARTSILNSSLTEAQKIQMINELGVSGETAPQSVGQVYSERTEAMKNYYTLPNGQVVTKAEYDAYMAAATPEQKQSLLSKIAGGAQALVTGTAPVAGQPETQSGLFKLIDWATGGAFQ
jgi:hypothetical protein